MAAKPLVVQTYSYVRDRHWANIDCYRCIIIRFQYPFLWFHKKNILPYDPSLRLAHPCSFQLKIFLYIITFLALRMSFWMAGQLVIQRYVTLFFGGLIACYEDMHSGYVPICDE